MPGTNVLAYAASSFVTKRKSLLTLTPGVVVITGAVFRASHFTIASVVVATVTKGEAVSLVGAQEVLGSGIDEGNEGPVPGVEKLTVDRLEISDLRQML